MPPTSNPKYQLLTLLSHKVSHGETNCLPHLITLLADEDKQLRLSAALVLGQQFPFLTLDSFNEKVKNRAVHSHNLFYWLVSKETRQYFLRLTTEFVCEHIKNYEVINNFLDSLLCFPQGLSLAREIMDKICSEPRLHKLYQRLVKTKFNLLNTRQIMVALTFRCNLSCPYCYSSCLNQAFSHDISIEDFSFILDWASSQDIPVISLTGGEPTIHPQIGDFLDMLNRQGFRYYFATNGLFDHALLSKMNPELILDLAVHITQFHIENQRLRKRLLDNLYFMQQKGIYFFFRVNLVPRVGLDAKIVFELCEQFHVQFVNYAPVFPDRLGQNLYFELENFPEMGRTLLEFVAQCAKSSIVPRLTKPVPLCLFNEQEIRFLAGNSLLMSTCSIYKNKFRYNLVINPDLSISSCIATNPTGLKLKASLTYDDLSELQKDHILNLIRRPLLTHCSDCSLYQLEMCQGACLAYKLLSK